MSAGTSMGTRPLVLLLLLPALVAPAALFAESEYWAALGSYTELGNAEAAELKASGTFAESFRVTPAITPKGYFFRVLAGPFLTAEIAADLVEQAQENGFEGAWVLVTDVLTATELPSAREAPAMTVGGDADVGADATAHGTTAPPEVRPMPERTQPPTVVAEAPPGYSLHKLIRNPSR